MGKLLKKLGIGTMIFLPLVLTPKDSLESSYSHIQEFEAINYHSEPVPTHYPIRKIPEKTSQIIQNEELLSPYFISMIGWVESKWNPRAISEKGARGITQIMEPTWKEFSELPFDRAFDPYQNIKTCERILENIQNYCDKNNPEWGKISLKEKREQILAAYHGGKARLKSKRWDISKMPSSTKNHLKKFERFL